MADVTLTAALTGFDGITGAFDDLTKSLSSAEGRANLFNKAALGIGAAIGGVITAATASAAVFINNADELSKLSQKVGISTEELSKLKYAADLSGVSMGGLQTGLTKLANTADAAASGSKEANNAFKKLGVSVKDAGGNVKSSNSLFEELAERFSKMPDGVEKTALAMDIFGKSGADLIPLLNSGADGLKDMGDEAAKFGAIVDGDAAKASEELNDNLGKLKGVFSGLINTGLQPILPLLADLSNMFIDGVKSGGLLQKTGKAMIVVFKGIVTAGIIVKNTLDTIVDIIYAMGKAAYEISRGNFKAAFESVKTGFNDVKKNAEDTSSGIEKVWTETAKKTEEESKKSNKEIVAVAKKSQKEIEAAVRARGMNEAKVQEQINDGWIAYYDNLAINDKAAQDQIEANNKKRAEIEVATATEINDNWKLYYDNLAINENARIEQNKKANEGIGSEMTTWLETMRSENENVYKNIGMYLTDMMNMGIRSIGNGVAAWIVEGKKFSLEDVFKQMATQFIAQLITMGIQMTITQTAMALGWIPVQVAGVGAGVAINTAFWPITLTIIAIAAAVAGAIYLFNHWGERSAMIGAAIVAAIFPVTIPIIAIIALIKEWDKVSAAASKAIEKAWAAILWPFEKLWDLIKAIIDGIKSITNVGDIAGSVGDALIPKELGQAGSWVEKKLIPKEIKFWAHGGSLVTNGPQMFVAGERGAERVTVEPAGTFSSKGRGGGQSIINFNAPVIFDEVSARRFVRMQNRYAGGRSI